MAKDVASALEQLTQNFIDTNFDRIDKFDQIIDDIYNENGDRAVLFSTLLQELHSLKGNAGTFGFMLVSTICHRLEDYLETSRRLKKAQWLEVQKYIDEIRKIFERGADPDVSKHDDILSSLPSSAVKEKALDATVVLVMEEGVIRSVLGSKLAELGVNISFAANPLDGLRIILALKPDMVISSQQLPTMTGLELAKVLQAIEVSKNISFALLTSNRELAVSNSIDVIYKDNTTAERIVELLKSL